MRPPLPAAYVIVERANPILVVAFVLIAGLLAHGAWYALELHAGSRWKPAVPVVVVSVLTGLLVWIRVRTAVVIDKATRSVRVERRRLRAHTEVLVALDRIASAEARELRDPEGARETVVVLHLKEGQTQHLRGIERRARQCADAINAALR
jgi:hypothetical protein